VTAGRLAVILALWSACGYRPLSSTLPGGKHGVVVVSPDTSRTDEPELSAMLTTELCRALGQAGIDVSTVGRGETVLRTRVLGLDGLDPIVSAGRRVAARRLQLRLELTLSDARDGEALWRSGLLELEQLWPQAINDPLRSETARRRTLQRLSCNAANLAVRRLTTPR